MKILISIFLIVLIVLGLNCGCGVVYLKSDRQLAYERKTGYDMQNHAVLHADMGKLDKKKKYMKMIQILTHYDEITNKSPILLGYLATAFYKTGYSGSTLITCEKIIEIDPRYPEAYFLMGQVYGYCEPTNKIEAIKMFKKCIESIEFFMNDEDMINIYGDLFRETEEREREVDKINISKAEWHIKNLSSNME